jgi:hypothetical protein
MVLKCLSIAWFSRVLELYGPQGFMHSMVHEGCQACVVWSISYLASYGPEGFLCHLFLMTSCVIWSSRDLASTVQLCNYSAPIVPLLYAYNVPVMSLVRCTYDAHASMMCLWCTTVWFWCSYDAPVIHKKCAFKLMSLQSTYNALDANTICL